jgi:hypothetical protein
MEVLITGIQKESLQQPMGDIYFISKHCGQFFVNGALITLINMSVLQKIFA